MDGRLRASPEPTVFFFVTGLLSPAVRSRALGRGPTTHVQYVSRPSEATRGVAGTNEEAVGRSRANRVGAVPERRYGTGRHPGGTRQMRPLHSSSIVIARVVPGLPSASL
ncbi:hypothetical protein GCM10009612_23090 [Streptomyces beijiangensis]